MMNRRNFLKCALGGATTVAALSTPLAGIAADTTSSEVGQKNEVRTINLFNVHTQESLKIAYQTDGRNIDSSLSKLNFFLRDHRQNEATLMDAQLFDQLWGIQQKLGGNVVFEIISAYRSPKTNAMLRAGSSNVARKSYHIRGRALDIRAHGVSTRRLRKQAMALQAGGVGYYPGSGFVHIDTGPVRSWRA